MSLNRRPSLDSIGQFISHTEFQTLKTGFAAKFPDAAPAVFLSKQTILDCISTYPVLSGISFRYGLADVNDPLSRKIILVPCEHTTDEKGAPDLVLLKEGYVSNNGEKVKGDELWKLLGNHAERVYNGRFHEVLSKVHRGYFWGIQRISALLAQEGCDGVMFNFGYNAAHPFPCKRNQQVLEAVDAGRQSLNIFMEYGQCNPPCDIDPGGGGGGVEGTGCLVKELMGRYGQKSTEQQLNALRTLRDDYMLEQPGGYALYEMYYFVSRPIIRAMAALPEKEQVYQDLYNNELQQALDLLNKGAFDQVLNLYKRTMAKLMETYVFETESVIC
ncbi:hypothetical protein SAMN04488505_105163 [Chitinophaga rupis]|uniref:Uncharacterized protein n=1 Tax=Chitinophaga rupis TaxID=573321 RepID=A0A1H7ZRR7_9BACT|nr:hypothetical protein [Chitinophaga rupis]SEM60504.1 hypothetical protein SAMN04488505_105163 [Chitinophaga rupis]